MTNKAIAALFTALVVFGGAPASFSAQDEPASHPQTQSETSAGRFKLKNRSSFAVSSMDAHNPFWPIGWTKSPAVPVAQTTAESAPAAVTLKADSFVVSSILLGNPPLAVINGREMAEGEIVAIQIGAQRLYVQLASVQDGRVVLRYLNQNLIVPLRRTGEPLPGSPTAAATANLSAAATASR
jgi:hypothetical protein